MKKMQKIGYMMLGAMLALVVSLTVPVFASTARQLTAHFNGIRVVVDGALITPRDGLGNVVEPFIVDGTTYLPVRAVAEAVGRTVEWDGATQTVYIGERPGTVQYLPDVVPAHQVSDRNQYREYSALQSGGAESFMLGGVRYVNGITFIRAHGGFWAVYNLNGQFTSFSGIVSQLDGGNMGGGNRFIRFFADDRMVHEVQITGYMQPQEFEINLVGVNQLRIETAVTVDEGPMQIFGDAGIGNPVIR